MVDIMDMEDIFYEIIRGKPYKTINMPTARLLAMAICKEVEAFVEGQQEIKCNNCEYYDREESFSETRRIMVEDRD